MSKHGGHDRGSAGEKSRGELSGGAERGQALVSGLGWGTGWLYVGLGVLLCMMGVLWQTTGVRADEEGRVDGNSSQVAESDEAPEEADANEAEVAEADEGSDEAAETEDDAALEAALEAALAGEADEAGEDEDLSADEALLMKLFEAYMAVEDPKSAEAKALEEQIDEVMVRLEASMEKDPKAGSRLMPGPPTEPGKAEGPDAAKKPAERPGVKRPAVNGVDKTARPEGHRSVTAGQGARAVTKPTLPKEPGVKEPAAAGHGAGAASEAGSEAEVAEVKLPEPNDVVQIKMEDGLLDVQELLDLAGKYHKFNILYDTTEAPVGKVRMQQYGEVHYRDLLPLLKSVLGVQGYVMVRSGSFVKIVKQGTAMQKTEPAIAYGAMMPEIGPGDSLVAVIVEAKHVPVATVQSFLGKFTSTQQVLTPVPNTNQVIITEYSTRLDRVLEMFRLVDQPGPERKLSITEVEYLGASDAKTRVEQLLKALVDQGATTVEGVAPAAPREPASPPAGARRSAEAVKRAVAERKGVASVQAGPTILVDERTNRLLVIGTEEEIKQIGELLAVIDVEPPSPEIDLVVMEVVYLEAPKVAEKVKGLYSALYQETVQSTAATQAAKAPAPRQAGRRTPTRRPAPTPAPKAATSKTLPTQAEPVIHVDERTNRLLVIGTAEQVGQIKELLALLDVPFGPEIKLVEMRVEHVEAAEVKEPIESLIEALSAEEGGEGEGTKGKPAERPAAKKGAPPTAAQRAAAARGARGAGAGESGKAQGPFILVDERTNRLLVVGSAEQIEQVGHLLALLDVEEGPEIKLAVVDVTYVLADEVAPKIKDLLEALSEQTDGKGLAGQGQERARRPEATRRPGTGRQEGQARPEPTRRAAETATSVEVEEGPFILVDERTNRLMVVGSEEQIDQVKHLLALLDVVGGPEINLVQIEIKNVIADEIADQLEQLMEALSEQEVAEGTPTVSRSGAGGGGYGGYGRGSAYGQRRTNQRYGQRYDGRSQRTGQRTSQQRGRSETAGPRGPFILVDARTNRLLVVGSEAHVAKLKELLEVLDVPPSEYDRLRLKIYQIEYVEAAEVLRMLDQLGITKAERMAPRDRARQDRYGRGQYGGQYGQQYGYGPEMARQRMALSAEGGEGLTGAGGLTGEGGPHLLPGQEEPEIRAAVQETTNKIFVLATEYQLRDIDEIIKQVDVDPTQRFGEYKVYQLENRKPEEVAGALEELLESEYAERVGEGAQQNVRLPGIERPAVIVPLEEVYSIAVRASKKQHGDIAQLLKVLDRRLPQVLVEAILVQVSTDNTLELGVSLQESWGTGSDNSVSGISPFGVNPTRTGLTKEVIAGSGGTLAFFDDSLVYATLEALQTEGNSKVVSMPRILVNDNEEGTISSERQEPTTRTTIPAGSDTPIVEFKEYVSAGTTLGITPHISEGDFLQLEITLDVNSFEGQGQANVPPPQSTNQITTLVTVPDDKTIVLGGLTTSTGAVNVSKVPLLGDLPLVGALFRNVSNSDTEAVLYVFVKAHIVRSRDEEGENDFSDIERLSETYLERLEQDEERYDRQLETIPGIPEGQRSGHVFDVEERAAAKPWRFLDD